MLSHVKSGYREPVNGSALRKFFNPGTRDNSQHHLTPGEPPPTPGLLKWTGQALLSVFTGTPKVEKLEPGITKKFPQKDNLRSQERLNALKPRETFQSRLDPPKTSGLSKLSTVSTLSDLASNPVAPKLSQKPAAQLSIGSKPMLKPLDDKQQGIMATSTPIAPRTSMGMLKYPTLAEIDEADDSGMTISSPSRKSVAFDEKMDSVVYFKDVSGSSMSNSHNEEAIASLDLKAKEPAPECGQSDNKNNPGAANSTSDASIYDLNKSGLPKDFPGRFPKSAIRFFPEDASFAATQLSENQTNMLTGLVNMIQGLFTNRSSPEESTNQSDSQHDEQDVATLIDGLQQTLNTLREDDTPESNKAAGAPNQLKNSPCISNEELIYLRKCETLMSNYRYATSLFAESMTDMTDVQAIKDVLLAVQNVLRSQGAVLTDMKHSIPGSRSVGSIDAVSGASNTGNEAAQLKSSTSDASADIGRLKQYIRDSVRSRTRKILEISNNESSLSNTSSMKARIKRARDAVFRELEQPGVKDSLMAALVQFQSADRTAMGDFQKHYNDMDSMSMSLLQTTEPALQKDPASEKELERVLQENKKLEKQLKELQEKSRNDQQTIRELSNELSRRNEHNYEFENKSNSNSNSNSISISKGTSLLGHLNTKENNPPTPALIKPTGYAAKAKTSNLKKSGAIRDWQLETDSTEQF